MNRTHRNRRTRASAALLCLLLVSIPLAACSSDDDADGEGTDDGGATTTAGDAGSGGAVRGVTDTEIVVGGIAQTELYPGLEEGARARLERANREGGVHGREIVLSEVKNDANDPATNLSLVRELVQQDEVFALLPVLSTTFLPQSSDFLAENKVPFVGWGIMPGFCGNDWGFGFNGCLVNNDAPNPSLIKAVLDVVDTPPEDLRYAFQAESGAAGESGNAQFAALAEAEGATVVYNEADIPVDQPVTDYAPYVQRILDADPNIVYTSTSFANAAGLAGTLTASGYDGAIVNFATYVPGLLEAQPDVAAALEGVYINTQIVPQESDSAAITQIEEDLAAIDSEPFVSLGAEIGYWAADVFLQMLEAVGPDLTPESFVEVVNGGFDYEPADGGIGAMTYPDAHDEPVACSAVVRVEDGEYVEAHPMTCY